MNFIQSLTGQTAQPPPLNLGQTQGLQGMFSSMPDIQQWANWGANFLPNAGTAFGNLFSNPFAGQAVGSAEEASGLGRDLALRSVGTGGALTGAGGNLFDAAGGIPGQAYGTMGAGQSLYPAGETAIAAGQGMIPGAYSILNAAFDPQQALYNRTAQQVQDQTRAAQAARGVQTTPYGAGVEGDVMKNFNIDWQNNLLNRMTQGAGAAGGLLGAGTGAMGTGAGILGTGAGMGATGVGELGTLAQIFGQGGNLANLGTQMQLQAPGYMAGLGALPYSTFQGIGNDQMQAIMQMLGYGGASQQLAQAPLAGYGQIYGLGNQQQQIASNIYGNQIKQQQNTFNDLMSIGKGLGSVFGMPMGGPPTLGSTMLGGLTSMFG